MWGGVVLGTLLLGVLSAQAAITLSSVLMSGDGNISINGVAASVFSIGTSTTSGTVTIGGEAQTGALTVGQSSGVNTVNIGTGAGSTTVNIATGAGENAVNIATGATSAKVVKVGTGAVANGIIIGSTSGAASTTIKAGTGKIHFYGQLVSTGTAPTVTAGGGAASVVGSDTAGTITSTGTQSSSTITFSGTYSSAPVCVFSAADATTAEATSTYISVSATNLAIYNATTSATYVWKYFCIRN